MDIITNAAKTSPFNRQRIFEKVPKFPTTICPEGRFILGEAVLFPNMNPFAENHAVVVICEKDFLGMTDFQPQLVIDGFSVAIDFFRAVHKVNSDAIYPSLMWNYMPPSAGSIIHPHFQVFVEKKPLPAVDTIFSQCDDYTQHNGSNFFTDLIKLEKRTNERFIFESKFVTVLATFAPRGLYEILFIINGVSSIVDLNGDHLNDFAQCLVDVLASYHALWNVMSFNLTSFSAPSLHLRGCFTLHFKLFARPEPKGVYTNDTGPMERVYDTWVIDSIPETVAKEMSAALQQSRANRPL
jgi:galactose-1-phosphate uridylyltransferase